MVSNFIMVSVQPFLFKQKVAVYQDGVCISTIKCSLDDIEDTIIALAKEYNINNIEITGKSAAYSLKIKDHLISKYTDKKLNINLC